MKERKITLIMKILAILVICLVSFVGIYVCKTNRYENIVKDYKLSKDLKGYREIVFEVSDGTLVLDSEGNAIGNTDSYDDETIQTNNYTKTDTKVNKEENLKVENYKTVKSIIEKRLEGLGVTDYNLSLSEETGKIYVQIPENDDTDHVVSNVLQVANFQIRDSEDNSKVYITNSDIKKASAVYNTSTNGTTVYLQIELNKKGTSTLKDISTNEYKTLPEADSTSQENINEINVEATTDGENEKSNETNTSAEENTQSKENSEETEESTSHKEKQKEIVLAIDTNKMVTTSFEEPIEDGVIDLSMGSSTTDSDKISSTLQSTSTIAILLNSGSLPLTYKITQNQYVKTDITESNLRNVAYVGLGCLAILFIIIIIKFKGKGIIGAISNLGFIALYLLLVRYTNVVISIEGIVGIAITVILNYWLTIKLLKINEPDSELKRKEFTKEYKSFISKVIPALVIAIVFSFIAWEKIATFGNVMFWGIVLVIIYNLIVTKKLID